MKVFRARRFFRRGAGVVLFFVAGFHPAAFGGGGGQNLLLVVNPGDEQQVRIAAEYQKLRHIPDCNIFFLEPRKHQGLYKGPEDMTVLISTYLTPIYQYLQTNGLSGQIDYISTLGMPFRLDASRSFQYLLGHMDKLVAGSETTSVTGNSRYLTPGSYTLGSNNAPYHGNDGLYVSTTLGFTGIWGNSPDDIIANLRRTADCDGSKPAGTVYFEENNDVRSNTRESQWPTTQSALSSRAVSYLQESDVSGYTPLNRSDVRGAVIGAAYYTVPNGSTYLPGSWADSLTSVGCDFWDRTQTKAAELIRAGVGGSSGTVTEPYAISGRFPNSHIFVYLADGSTLGEAFYQSVSDPLLQTMLGDPLGQPYADVPEVSLTDGPEDGGTVSGTVVFRAAATLSSPVLATGIDRIDLYVDGKCSGTTTNSGLFNLDTSALSDGRHEVRLVAVNNAAAESQGFLIRNINVDNSGRSVAVSGNGFAAGTALMISVPVTSTAGSDTISRVELRYLGQSVGQLSAASGDVSLDVSRLAYGTNTILPVAVFSDGTVVEGDSIEVSRDPVWRPGTTPLLAQNRQAGILGEYFYGQGGASIDASMFSGTPDVITLHSGLLIGVYNSSIYTYTEYGSSSSQMEDVEPNPAADPSNPALVDGLSARYSGRFEVKEAGEYNFFFFKANDSVRLLIDGQIVIEYNGAPVGAVYGYAPSIFLGEGEHTFELLTANTNSGTNDGYFDTGLYVRGPDGLTRLVDNTLIYQYSDSSLRPGTFSDDFESYTAGSAIGGTNGWTDVNWTAEQGFIVAQTNSVLSGGGQSMHLLDTTTNSTLSDVRLQTLFPEAMTSVAITFDFMAETSAQTPILTVRSGTGMGLLAEQIIAMTITPGGAGYVKYHDGSVWQSLAAGLELNTWYRFVITVQDVASGIVDLVIEDANGEVLNRSGLAFRNAGSSLLSMDFATNAGSGKSGGSYYIDNIHIRVPTSSRYDVWAAEYGLIGGAHGDDDGDGVNNLIEYSLGGNPTNSLNQGYHPVSSIYRAGGTNWMDYVYLRRYVEDSGLTYSIELNDDLLLTNWISAGYLELPAAGSLNRDFETVTNRIEMNEDRNFIRLRIQEK
jgi:uncharacterized protein (TIGR03790 family)